MEASGREPGMLQGLSRFLVQHERCGAGFDVAHPAGLGSGRVTITCRGCGARHEYATATIDVERELGAERTEVEGAAAAAERGEAPAQAQRPATIPPRPAPYPDRERRRAPEPEPSARRRVRSATGARSAARRPSPPQPGDGAVARPRRGEGVALRRVAGSPGFTLVVAAVAATALAFALVQAIGDDDGSPVSTTDPTPSPKVGVEAPQAPPPSAPDAGGPAELVATSTLRTELYTIEVPRGWSRTSEDGGVVLEPRGGGRVNVQIYYERSPQLSRAELARETSEFMRRQVPGAALYPRRIQIGGRPAFEVTARGPGETAIAVDVLRGPYRFLLVRRIFAGAKPHVSRAAGRVVRSFRPI